MQEFNPKMGTGRFSEEDQEPVKLDAYDKKILSHLSDDSRMPLATLAKKLKLSRDTVDYRVKRLVKEGVITKFAPIVNLKFFDYEVFHVFFIVNDITGKRKQELINKLKSHPNTRGIMEYSDKWDLEWTLVAKDIQDYDDVLTKITGEFGDIILEKNKIATIRGYKSVHLPFSEHTKEKPEFRPHKKKKHNYHPDNTDLDILKILCEDCRTSSYVIADKLKLSSNAVRYRIKNMVDNDLIRQFSIVVDLSKLSFHWHTICMDVRSLDHAHNMKFKEFVANQDSIIRAVKVLGAWDLMITIVDSDIRKFHWVMKEVQANFADILTNYQTLSAYQEHAYDPFPKVIFS